ncbi:MAG: two-component system, chemotaxis family, sensor kinase CheA [Blastocatellia bacterium]
MDDFTQNELAQLLAVYREQTLHLLDEMTADLLALEACTADDEALARLRRAAHTIKGDSVCVMLEGVAEIAHRIEDLMENVMARGGDFDRNAVDAMLGGLDLMREAIDREAVADVSAAAVKLWADELDAETIDAAHEDEMPAATAAIDSLPEQSSAAPAARRTEPYVRIEAEKIDMMLNLASEMVIARSVLNQVGAQFEQQQATSELLRRARESHLQISKLISELQKNVLRLRMVTIDTIFKRFARPMRQLAIESGKRLELEMLGGETELDRALTDALYEPLLHLLRNAVDHGIETPGERTAADKPDVARITVRAYHDGNQIVVEVRDDGRGLMPEALKAKAIRAGLISKARAAEMNDKEAFELLFLDGLSTAAQVTQVSGRGVGAAAVKRAIEALHGSVTVASEAAVGTCFTLRLPLTLAIIRALMFAANGQWFALPLLAISEVARIQSSEITQVDGVESYRLRDRFISVVRPGWALDFERRRGGAGAALRTEAERLFVIVVAIAGQTFGIRADALYGEEAVVIKALDNQWLHNDAIAGATLVGNGQIVLILDAENVLRKAIRFERLKREGKRAYAS